MVAKARDTAPFSSRDAQKKKKSTTEKKVKRGHAASVGRPTKPPHERARVVQRRGGGGDRAGPPAQRRCAGVPSAGVPAAQCGTQAVSPFQRPRRGGGEGGRGPGVGPGGEPCMTWTLLPPVWRGCGGRAPPVWRDGRCATVGDVGSNGLSRPPFPRTRPPPRTVAGRLPRRGTRCAAAAVPADTNGCCRTQPPNVDSPPRA